MYTKAEILSLCCEAAEDIKNFYKQDFINYRGVTSDTKELYSELTAEYVTENIDKFLNSIPIITREESYRTVTHEGHYNADSGRIEEITAVKMFNQSKLEEFEHIGKIIDYQTPLKNKRSDETGKIDLLSDDGSSLIILELKKPDSSETMLRCVLEGFTYLKTVNKSKLLLDFGKPDTYGLSAAPLVFRNGSQHREMTEGRIKLKKLMKLLNIKPYYVSEISGKYFITED